MALEVRKTGIDGVVVVDATSFEDKRGRFTRMFCENELGPVLGLRHIVQINQSVTMEIGAIRGLHFQRTPDWEMKLVRCTSGRMVDVAVDLRAGSPTFLHWHAEELSPGNSRMLIVPEGCAHGFQVLEEKTEVLYLVTAAYAPKSEGGIRYDDPLIAISWPIPATDLSAKDLAWPSLATDFSGLLVRGI